MSEMTFYATGSDGWNYPTASSPYSAVHNAANAATQYTNGDYLSLENDLYAGIYYVCRAYLYFDTSALPDGAVISAATLSLYGSTHNNANGYLETDAGHADIGIVQGVQDEPLTLGDFGDELNYTTLGHNSYFDVSVGWNCSSYHDIPFNATGIGWINKTGTTKLCVKCKGDIINAAPSGLNYTQFCSNEKGSGYQPKLVVTYSEVETKTSADSGSGAEAIALRELGVAETGAGVEASLAAVALTSGDTGSGVDMGGLLQDIYSQDEGAGTDNVKILTGKAGYDMRLHNHKGQVSLTHKEVNL
jgi:hypothetical protein